MNVSWPRPEHVSVNSCAAPRQAKRSCRRGADVQWSDWFPNRGNWSDRSQPPHESELRRPELPEEQSSARKPARTPPAARTSLTTKMACRN